MSKASLAASVYSKNAASLEFNRKPGDITSGNSQPYGSLTISQKAMGFDTPNVQAAIDDVYATYELPKGSVIINKTDLSPNAVQQSDTYKFTGTATETAKIKVFGYVVQVTKGDTAAQVVTKAITVLRDAQARQECFSEVLAVPTDGSIINVKYIDTQKHQLTGYIVNGIKIEVITRDWPKPGYGTWTKIGQEAKTLNGNSFTLYYFERTA